MRWTLKTGKAAMGDTSLPYCGKETELCLRSLNQQGCNFSVVAMIEVCLERNSTDGTPGTSLRQYVPGARLQQYTPGAKLNRSTLEPHSTEQIGTLTITTHH